MCITKIWMLLTTYRLMLTQRTLVERKKDNIRINENSTKNEPESKV
jgi:hypothetical protein